MNTDQQNDPYTHLKDARADGKIIQWHTSTGWADHIYPDEEDPMWRHPAKDYRVKPDTLPADKWAAEKAAYAQGKRIETRWMHDGDWTHWVTCKRHPSTWHSEYTSQEYRIAPGPAPAGKLTDEQLAEIYQNATSAAHVGQAVFKWGELSQYHRDARIEGIRSMREAVEKGQAEEIARLTAELSTVNAERAETRVIRSEMIKAQAELAKANAELERLRWRSVEVKPTKEDADPEGFIEVMGKTDKRFLIPWYEVGLGKESLWRPFYPPPAPTAEESERERFEQEWRAYCPTDDFTVDEKAAAWHMWKTRAAKEGGKV